ncbi:nuclear transport factor 2 family protein [Dysgonomonas sp. ZJ279]|uniref:nuclear transport factor 2 family protein n=1 Tax=Dysgonomonas sp. ZJ279 TaxID=2709796 RepID=UPI0013EA25F9|nr:nuclear transport factor 2 family protein [Dysgonomonas sp. ZJ279]
MRKFLYTTIILFVFILASSQQAKSNNPKTKDKMEEQKIEKLLEEKYINAVANELNTDKMLELFHPDFAIFSADGNNLAKFPLLEWKKVIDDYKVDNKGNADLRNLTHEFVFIDITGTAAIAKVQLYRRGELIATDYISLLKFNNDWKIVAKVPYAHIEKPF